MTGQKTEDLRPLTKSAMRAAAGKTIDNALADLEAAELEAVRLRAGVDRGEVVP